MSNRKSKSKIDIHSLAQGRLDLFNRYQNRLLKIANKQNHWPIIYARILLSYLELKKKLHYKVVSYYQRATEKLVDISHLLSRRYVTWSKTLYNFARKTTVPFNYLWFYFLKKWQRYSSSPLLVKGIHYITALQGGGKSSIVFDIIEEIRRKTGLGSYVNVTMENPKYDDINDIWYKFHAEFDEADYWGVSKIIDPETKEEREVIKQLKQFDKNFPNIVLDEWLSKMNHRQNKTKDYGKVFIALMQSLVHIRHQGLDHAYILSQLDTTDIQLMGIFKFIHEVDVDLNISYSDWVKTGKLNRHIKGWWVYTYMYKKNRKKVATEKILYRKHYRVKTFEDSDFSSLNQAHIYKELPGDKIRYKKGNI